MAYAQLAAWWGRRAQAAEHYTDKIAPDIPDYPEE
jgi:hypothetical protein